MSCDLRSTYPGLTNVGQEPLPLRRTGFPPVFAATITRIRAIARSTRTSPPCFNPSNAPRYQITLFCVLRGIGTRFSPVHFRCGQTRRVSCYAILRGWLLLSLPPPCLRPTTSFCLAFDRDLRALTSVSFVQLSAMGLTPMCPTAEVYNAPTFGV